MESKHGEIINVKESVKGSKVSSDLLFPVVPQCGMTSLFRSNQQNKSSLESTKQNAISSSYIIISPQKQELQKKDHCVSANEN